MASEDVIELGSSDDEAEPAPKKVKPSSKPKPKPDAMVHIPNKLHGVTIKPTKPIKPPLPNIPGVAQKTITVTKVSPGNQYSVNKVKVNGQPGVKVAPLKFNANVKQLVKPIPVVSPKVNPMALMKKLNTSQVVINKVQPNSKLFKHPVKSVPRAQFQKNMIQIRSPRTLNNLPPSITIKRAVGGTSVKRPAVAATSNMRKKQKVIPKGAVGDVLTVELDDDESLPSTSSPQWYLRPEQQVDPLEIEAANNKEPEPPKFIEITIEDSPVKPTSSKRACEVGTELSITIEDSPIKQIQAKSGTSVHSDDDEIDKSTENDEPHSKKKLEYPKETEINTNNDTIEIEIEPMITANSNKERENEHQDDAICIISETFQDTETPVNKSQNVTASTPKKENRRSSTKVKETESEKVNAKEIGEFHPAYQSFIDLCLKLEDSDDMKKIVDKKIKGYYRQVPKEYTESEEFIDMVSSKVISIKAGPEKMYLYIKDIVDELNLQRKMAKAQPTSKETKSAESEKFLYGEDSEFDTKRQRQIRKLEKTLKKLHRAIQKLEEQEVDFDDDEDSVYLLTESDDGSCSSKDIDRQLEKNRNDLLKRYKERMVRVHAKFCQLTNTKMPSEPRVQLDARPGHPAGAAKRLEKWINRKVPSGTPLPFPDFHDVLRCVREANDEDKLGWNEADIMEEARDLFTRCGKKLQRRRQENEWRLAASRIAVDIDPAEQSDDLKKKLEDNKKLATKKETEVFNKYADRQSQLKLEAEEIGDKEAEESPVESEEEEPVEERSALENKEKRKERIRRIINEKSKKNIDEEEPKKSQDTKSGDIEDMNIDDSSIRDPKNNDQKQDMEIDLSVSKDVNDQTNEEPAEVEAVHSISDESNQVGSEIDELHLLQKLHSGNEISSTVDSSDTDTPIDISDTIQSSGDNKGKQASDVISIENSSYSESENNKDTNNSKDDETDRLVAKEGIKEIVDENVEAENSTSPKKRTDQTNNDEYNDTVENILLASSDDEPDENKDANPASEEVSVNLKDDDISISDTVVEGTTSDNDENKDASPASEEVSVNLKDDAISIGDTIVEGTENDENKDASPASEEVSVNLKDDAISIGDTIDEGTDNDENKDASPASEEVSANLKDDAISIGDTIVEGTASGNDEANIENKNGENISVPTDIANDDNSEDIVFVSEGDKKEESMLNGSANDDSSLSNNPVQNAEISEVFKITDAKEVENTGSKVTTNSIEAMEISEIRDIEGDNNTSIETNLENNNLKKDEIAEESTAIPSKSNDVAKILLAKDTNDKEETVDSLLDEIRLDLESQEPLKAAVSIQQNNEL